MNLSSGNSPEIFIPSQNTRMENVFKNPLIISHILLYLNVSDRLNCCEINTAWRDESVKSIRKLKCITLMNTKDVEQYISLRNVQHTEYKFHDLMNVFAIVGIPAESEIFFTGSPTFRYTPEERRILKTFYDKFGVQIVKLEGSGIWAAEKEFETFLNMFPNLESLTLSISIEPRVTIMGWGKQFPNVKKLSLRFRFTNVEMERIKNTYRAEHFSKLIVATLKSVTELEFRPWKLGWPEQYETYFFEKILEQAHNFQNVKALTCFSPVERITLTRLKVFPNTLERLELLDSFSWSNIVSGFLLLLLEHHAPTLRYLKVPVNLIRFRKLKRDEQQNFEVPLLFPQMPELKELCLEFFVKSNFDKSNVFRLKCDTTIECPVTFPKLESLNVHVRDSSMHRKKIQGSMSIDCLPWIENINSVFIPKTQEEFGDYGVSTSVKELQLTSHFPPETDINDIKAYLRNISRTFPNVRNPRLDPLCIVPEENIFTTFCFTDAMVELI